jgi:protein TonB
LDEDVGQSVNLNTKEFLYANYINQIRRLVVFYWRQQLDNLPRSLRISKPRYKTVVYIALNEDGLLDEVQVLETSGVGPLDNAVVEAFKIAGPYPEPPEGLMDPDGRARLSDMAFTVEVGQANSAYRGIDPRSGIQFPGILKSPR